MGYDPAFGLWANFERCLRLPPLLFGEFGCLPFRLFTDCCTERCYADSGKGYSRMAGVCQVL